MNISIVWFSTEQREGDGSLNGIHYIHCGTEACYDIRIWRKSLANFGNGRIVLHPSMELQLKNYDWKAWRADKESLDECLGDGFAEAIILWNLVNTAHIFWHSVSTNKSNGNHIRTFSTTGCLDAFIEQEYLAFPTAQLERRQKRLALPTVLQKL